MKRSFEKIRKAIIETLEKEPKSITAVARSISSTWLTAKKHLEWLEFKKKVMVVERNERAIVYKAVE